MLIQFAPGLLPVLKDRSAAGRKAALARWGNRGGGREVTADDVAAAFEGTYTTDKGVTFQLKATTKERQGELVVAGGDILSADGRVIGEWARGVNPDTGVMEAQFLTVGKGFRRGGGDPTRSTSRDEGDGLEEFRRTGIALEIQKQTERAARDLGLDAITVKAEDQGSAAWANERFGYRFSEKPSLRGSSSGKSMYHKAGDAPEVKAAFADIEARFRSPNRDDWPAPHEILSLGGSTRDYGDIAEGRTYGEFLLSWGWKGSKPSSHVTKAVGLLTLTVESQDPMQKGSRSEAGRTAALARWQRRQERMRSRTTADRAEPGVTDATPARVARVAEQLSSPESYSRFRSQCDKGGGCEDAAAAVEEQFGIPQVHGTFVTKTGEREYHSWNQDDSGWIVDAGQDVFRNPDGEGVLVYPPNSSQFILSGYGVEKGSRSEAARIAANARWNQNRGLGIDRADMPQIPKKNRDKFFSQLKAEGVEFHDETVDPRSLKQTQSGLNPKQTKPLLDAMRDGTFRGATHTIIAARDGHILDGHHRWDAARQFAAEGGKADIKITRVDMPIRDLLERAAKFNAEEGIEARTMETVSEYRKAVTVTFAPGLQPVLKGSRTEAARYAASVRWRDAKATASATRTVMTSPHGRSLADDLEERNEAFYRAIRYDDYSGYDIGSSKLARNIGKGIGTLERKLDQFRKRRGWKKETIISNEDARKLREDYERRYRS